MPLVAPLLNPDGGDDIVHKWTNELVGKKIGDVHNETTFAKTELPKEHRIVREGDFATTDHKPDRLNIHTAKDGTVAKISFG